MQKTGIVFRRTGRIPDLPVDKTILRDDNLQFIGGIQRGDILDCTATFTSREASTNSVWIRNRNGVLSSNLFSIKPAIGSETSPAGWSDTRSGQRVRSGYRHWNFQTWCPRHRQRLYENQSPGHRRVDFRNRPILRTRISKESRMHRHGLEAIAEQRFEGVVQFESGIRANCHTGCRCNLL